ncbi:MAG: DUF3781 domain-containing protein [Treponema sp.]|nr:DUF3781 domain-containing protein [Treponema sp.]
MNKICVEKLHPTALGAERIRRNLCLDADDVVRWCKQKIGNPNSHTLKKGKNWYIDGCMITVNVHSSTIITAQREK